MEQINSPEDTICAVSTPPGCGGIAVVRVSGPDALAVVDRLWSGATLADVKTHTAHLGTVSTPDGEPLDQAVATVFRGPRSFTGQDTVEISVHGSVYIQQQLLQSLVAAGARMAEPGEFTRRAFVNGRLDLAEAEAVADMIASTSRAAHRLAISQLQGRFSSHISDLHDRLLTLASLLELELDFSEEDVTFADRQKLRELALEVKATVDRLASTFSSGQALREGIPVTILGEPNVGKSRLLNALLDADRAIVSDIPGTTRDTVEDTMEIQGTLYRFIDTAGLRATDDPVERLGIARALDKAARAHIVLWVTTAQSPATPQTEAQIRQAMPADSTLLKIINKIDLADPGSQPSDAIPTSALTGAGIDRLKSEIHRITTAELPADESMIVTNARHHAALRSASQALDDLLAGLDNGLTPDLLAEHLRVSIAHLASITGNITSTQILNTIFSRFCIGK